MTCAGLAHAAADPTPPTTAIVLVDGGKGIKLKLKAPIHQAFNDKGQLLWTAEYEEGNDQVVLPISEKDVVKRMGGVATISPSDRGSVRVGGRAVGSVRFTIVDKKGNKEVVRIDVRRRLFIPLGETQVLAMASGKAIKIVAGDRGGCAAMEPIPEESLKVKITGREVGDTLVAFTGEDGSMETVEVVIRSTRRAGKGTILLPPGELLLFPAKAKEDITVVDTELESVCEVRPGPTVKQVRLVPRKPGASKMTVQFEGGKKESFEVIVARDAPLITDKTSTIHEGETLRLPISNKRPAHVEQMDGDGECMSYETKEAGSKFEMSDLKPGVYIFAYTDKDEKPACLRLRVVKKAPAKKKE
jgi:hypothetical protein